MFVWGLSSRERICLQDRSCELRWKSYSATQELAFFGGRPLFFLGGSAGADASPSPSPPSPSHFFFDLTHAFVHFGARRFVLAIYIEIIGSGQAKVWVTGQVGKQGGKGAIIEVQSIKGIQKTVYV